MINSDLWTRTTWINKSIDYLFGVDIKEYDMKSAGLNIIKQYKLLPSDKIAELEKMDKKTRNIKIGLIQRENKELVKQMLEGFKEGRRMFLQENNLKEGNIVSIKKDAIFVIDKKCNNLVFDNIHFEAKNQYSSYIRLNKIEFYLNPKEEIIHLKGFGQGEDLDEVLRLHGEYILDFISTFSRMRELLTGQHEMIFWLMNFIKSYRERTLPIGYYRELNREHAYRLMDENLKDPILVADTDDKYHLDISYNYMNYIVPLAGLYV